MRKYVLFLFSLLAASNLVCLASARDYDQDHFFTKSEPKKEQLVGQYLPTAETIDLIKDEGPYELQDVSVSLHADGSFEVKNMPDWWLPNDAGFGKSDGGVDSGAGTWTMSQENLSGLWQITLDFQSGVFHSTNYAFAVTLDLGGEQPPYSIWIYVGDPDRGRVMIFEQVVENP